jgi:hypothetical protein
MKLPPPDATFIEYEMGYGADEFGKVLNGLFSGDKSSYHCLTTARHHWRIEQQDAEFQLDIKVFEKSPRKLGLFSLPGLMVEFRIKSTEPELRKKFFSRFFKYFHKGGG